MRSVRRATSDDAGAIGRVHVAAWVAAYRGEMPDDYLDSLSASERADRWRVGLSRARDHDPVFVVEQGGEVLGFAAVGVSTEAPGTGELFALNIDPAHWGTGAGRMLLGAACVELQRLGFGEAVLWVLPANARARRFYAAGGWSADGAERVAEVWGVSVPEVRYQRRLRREIRARA